MKFTFDKPPNEWESIYTKCNFTDAENEIINYKRRGWYNMDIAVKLYISERTVRRKINIIKDKILSVT